MAPWHLFICIIWTIYLFIFVTIPPLLLQVIEWNYFFIFYLQLPWPCWPKKQFKPSSLYKVPIDHVWSQYLYPNTGYCGETYFETLIHKSNNQVSKTLSKYSVTNYSKNIWFSNYGLHGFQLQDCFSIQKHSSLIALTLRFQNLTFKSDCKPAHTTHHTPHCIVLNGWILKIRPNCVRLMNYGLDTKSEVQSFYL